MSRIALSYPSRAPTTAQSDRVREYISTLRDIAAALMDEEDPELEVLGLKLDDVADAVDARAKEMGDCGE